MSNLAISYLMNDIDKRKWVSLHHQLRKPIIVHSFQEQKVAYSSLYSAFYARFDKYLDVKGISQYFPHSVTTCYTKS